MSYFPSYSGLQKRDGATTRRSLGIENITTLYKYINDTEPDDMASLYIDNLKAGQDKDNSLPVDYKTIVMTLLLNYYKNLKQFSGIWDEIDEQLEEIINEILENIPKEYNITSNIILKNTIQNAIKLYTIFFSLPNVKQLGILQDIELYSGIRSYKMIVKYNLDILSYNDIFILPTFISTTLSRDTALRFQDPMDRAMIHFLVPESKLEEFKYAPLFKKDLQYPQNLKDSIRENEILLPPYSEFIFRGSERKTLPFYTWVFNARGALEAEEQAPVETNIYYLEFVSFGKMMPDKLEKEIAKNLNVNFKRRGGKKTKRKYKRGKKTRRCKKKEYKKKKIKIIQ